MTDFTYLDNYENRLQETLLQMASDKGFLAHNMLITDDFDELWHSSLVVPYLRVAINDFAQYPTVAIGWAAYLGMAVAYGWDADWETTRQMPLESYYGVRGWDDLDDHVVVNVLQLALDSEDAKQLTAVIRTLAETALHYLKKEDIEPQSELAFHTFARTVKVLYHVGVAIGLKRLGYELVKM